MGESILPRSWPKPRRSPAGPTKGGSYLIVGLLLVLLGAALGWSRSGIAISAGAILSAIGALAVPSAYASASPMRTVNRTPRPSRRRQPNNPARSESNRCRESG